MGVTSVKTAPAVEPVGLSEIKDHLAISFTEHDSMLQGMLRAARRNLEWTYERAMITQTLVLTLDRFDRAAWEGRTFWGVAPQTWALGLSITWSILEVRSPVQQINSITYIDTAGVTQTMATSDYSFAAGSEASVGRVYPILNKVWPAVAPIPAAVKVEYVAGYTTPELVPDDWKAAIKLYVGHLYANREQVIADARAAAIVLPYGIEELMGRYAPGLLA